MMSNLRSNIIWQYGLQALKYLFPFMLVPYLTRTLGAEGYAVYAYLLSFMGIVQTLADFGFMLSGTKKAIKLRGDKEGLSRLLGSVTQARLLLLVILSVAVSIAAQFIPLMRGHFGYVALAFIATGLRSLLPDFIFQGYEEMGPLTTRYFASKLVTLVGTVVLVRSPDDLLLVAVVDIIGGVVSLIWSLATINKKYGARIKFGSFGTAIGELKTSAIYCVSNIGTTLVSGFTTFVVGVALTDPVQIAYWSLAMTTIGAVQSLYSPISNSLYPYVMARGDLRPAIKIGLVALPILAIGTVAYCSMSDIIFRMLGGADYAAGSWVMVALSPMLPISFYSILIGWPVLGAMEKVRELTVSTVFSGLLNASLLTASVCMGQASLLEICVVRCVSELALLLSRALVIFFSIKGSRHDG